MAENTPRSEGNTVEVITELARMAANAIRASKVDVSIEGKGFRLAFTIQSLKEEQQEK